MKKIFLAIIVLGWGIASVKAQSAPATTGKAATPAMETVKMQASVEVPDAAKKQFATEYPNVKDAKWERNGNDFAAVFNDNGNNKRIIYSADGKMVMSYISQPVSSTLPA